MTPAPAPAPVPSPAAPSVSSEGPSGVTPELVTRLRQGTLRLARRFRQEADPGFGQSLVSALATIDRHGPLTLGELAEHERLAPPSITKLVGRLEAEGLVQRSPHPDDGRAVSVAVTRAGATRLAQARRRTNEWLAARIHDLDLEDEARIADAVALLEALLAEEQR